MTIKNETHPPEVPAWLNLDAIVPPELRDRMVILNDLSRDVLDAVCRFLMEGGDAAGDDLAEAVVVIGVDGLHDVVNQVTGLDATRDRMLVAAWLLEGFIGGSPVAGEIERLAPGLSDAADTVGWSEFVAGEVERRAARIQCRQQAFQDRLAAGSMIG